MTEEQRHAAKGQPEPEASDIVARIEELGARCEALESSNAYLAAQLTEVGQAWRDAFDALAAADPASTGVQVEALRKHADASSGLRRQIFSEMADILEGKVGS